MEALEARVVDQLINYSIFKDVETTCFNKIKIKISDRDYNYNMGAIIMKIQKIIDENNPERDENLFMIIRCENTEDENVIKIWKTV